MLSLKQHAKITAAIAAVFVLLLIVGSIAERREWLNATEEVQIASKIIFFSLTILLFFSIIPLMIKTVLSFQVWFGNGNHFLIKPLIVHEAKIVWGYWILLLAGLAIAIPVAIQEGFFSAAP